MEPRRTLTYFLSDLHLGARYFMDPREQERMVCAWLRSIASTARRIYLAGDVLDYWFEYRHVVPRGFVRFLGTLAELADSGIEITWLTGNHDIWIFDYLPSELGIRVMTADILDEEIDGKRFVIGHGDGLGPVGNGERVMRAVFHNRLLQRCFASVHPRWTVGLAYWWSGHNRRKHHTGSAAMPASPAPLLQWVNARVDHPDFYVFGHYHVMLEEQVGRAKLVILGDWIRNMSYAVFDGRDLTLHRADLAAPQLSIGDSAATLQEQ